MEMVYFLIFTPIVQNISCLGFLGMEGKLEYRLALIQLSISNKQIVNWLSGVDPRPKESLESEPVAKNTADSEQKITFVQFALDWLVDHSLTPQVDDVVIAAIDGELTCKCLGLINAQHHLLSGNELTLPLP